MEDNPKVFGALLNGVFKRFFENDTSITPELLHEQVYQSEVDIEGLK